MKIIQPTFNHRPPVPAADASDDEFVAYGAAYDAWYVDRAGESAWDRIAMAESDAGHAEAMTRAAALSA